MQKEVSRWRNLAEDDLEKARILFNNEKYDGAIFFCQQTVEKALKALWILEKKTEVPRYHDLLFFFQKLELPAKFKTTCEDLTGGYIATRYPTNLPFSFTKKETEILLLQSEEILLWVKKKLL
ncbi:MAG: HEPN domain-containing protein [Nanoarchaeota archaeon]|nr:HEPN domain-containing protein [Nanoarchaeota archaeon]